MNRIRSARNQNRDGLGCTAEDTNKRSEVGRKRGRSRERETQTEGA